jgi:hypothetical protein
MDYHCGSGSLRASRKRQTKIAQVFLNLQIQFSIPKIFYIWHLRVYLDATYVVRNIKVSRIGILSTITKLKIRTCKRYVETTYLSFNTKQTEAKKLVKP